MTTDELQQVVEEYVSVALRFLVPPASAARSCTARTVI